MILPQLQEALVAASDTMVARQRRRTQRFRLGLMTSAAVVTLGGGAVASQSLWAPLLGWEDGNRPTASAEPVPSAQEQLLGVLRRDQDAGDRSPAARSALTTLSNRYVGVKVASVRVVPATDGSSSVIVPVTTVRGSVGPAGAPVRNDAVCMHIAFRGADADAGRRCWSTTNIRRGGAVLSAGENVRGIVPDGVSRVRFAVPGGRPYDARVRDNVFVASLQTVSGATGISWLDPKGTVKPFSDGRTTRDVLLPVTVAVIPASMHDCGHALGGVVPKRIPCGPRSRKYVPKIGVTQYPTQKP
jgi:hypothetical protein